MTARKNFVSLFSGAGGLDVGLEMAGWECAYASDIDENAVKTMIANKGLDVGGTRAFDRTHVERANVTTMTAGGLLSKAGLRRGEVALLAGGPPCQSWSSAGHQRGFDDPRGRLFDDFVRLANGIDARWLLLENVRGLLTARAPDGAPGSALELIRRRLLKDGYQTVVSLLNAADFGVPQRRVRLFIVGFRAGDAPAFPAPTHSKDGQTRWVTLGEALSSLSALAVEEVIRPNETLAALLSQVPPGKGLKSEGKAERTRPSGHWGYRQGCFVADLGQSARTVTAGSQQDWVLDPALGLRKLAPRECAAIQGFHPDWEFEGNHQTQYKLIGNAVPPPLAKAVGESLATHHETQVKIEVAASAVPTTEELIPLPPRLEYHVRYTTREERSNGASRRAAQGKRKVATA